MLKRLISLCISSKDVVRCSCNPGPFCDGRRGVKHQVIWIIVGDMSGQIHQVITLSLPCRVRRTGRLRYKVDGLGCAVTASRPAELHATRRKSTPADRSESRGGKQQSSSKVAARWGENPAGPYRKSKSESRLDTRQGSASTRPGMSTSYRSTTKMR